MKDPYYLKWKRKNVTLRGMKDPGQKNGVYGSFGEGLYTCSLSNRAMALQYGKVYFVVNGRPKSPKKFKYLNDFEIFRQKYESVSAMQSDLILQGYDGVEIPGREMVNYAPQNVYYFSDETNLINYYNYANN